MNCLHPHKKIIVDAITGEKKEITYPCGHCINCLHAYQDMWSIRLTEEFKDKKVMIYDTLTVKPDAMFTYSPNVNCTGSTDEVAYADIYQPMKVTHSNGTVDYNLYGTTVRWRRYRADGIMKSYRIAKKYYPQLDKESWKILVRNGGKVLWYPKKQIQDWIKRGRQAFERFYGYRCDMSYFCPFEYGAVTSRPHFHILVFGISYQDYMRFFGNPWRKNVGWTKPVTKIYNAESRKDCSNIVRYVSKYCSKGVFESPLVKCGLAPKPYKLISKGIGEGYLNKAKFDKFRTPEFRLWANNYSIPFGEKSFEKKCNELAADKKWKELYKFKADYKAKKAEIASALEHKRYNEFLEDIVGDKFKREEYIDMSSLADRDYDTLAIYRDEKGFPHAMPQFYKNKLLNSDKNEPNIYKFEVQNVLQSRARLHDNQAIQQEAVKVGIIIPDEWLDKDSSLWHLSSSDMLVVNQLHMVEQGRKAETLAERRYSRLKNLYGRGKMNIEAPAIL